MRKINGSCLCNQIKFSCEDNFQQFHLCHCKQCQKTTGSAHVSNLFTSPDNVIWLAGKEHIIRFDMPGRSISSAFCSHCGSPVPYLSKTGKALVVPAGALDATPTLNVQDNIFWEERADWYDAGIHSDKCAGFPD